jgi:hypothetical protein
LTQALGDTTTEATFPAGVLPAEPHRSLYIDGQWTSASGSDRFSVTDPATAQVLAEVAIIATVREGVSRVQDDAPTEDAQTRVAPREGSGPRSAPKLPLSNRCRG